MKLVIIEIFMFIQIPLIWYLFRRFLKRNITGELAAGAMIGVFNEFATEPLWNYHLYINVYKDTPLAVVLGWGVMFVEVTFISEVMYCFFLNKDRIAVKDVRILFFDMLSAALVAFPLETIGIKLGVWDYRYEVLQWNWGNVPYFNMPYEALFGYICFMLVTTTFVRYWHQPFEDLACLRQKKYIVSEGEQEKCIVTP